MTAPIHVIPRAVQPEIFDTPARRRSVHAPRGAATRPGAGRASSAPAVTRARKRRTASFASSRGTSRRSIREATLTMLGDGPDTRATTSASRAKRASRIASSSRARCRSREMAGLLRVRRPLRARVAQRDLRQRHGRSALVRHADGRVRRRHGRVVADQGRRERRPARRRARASARSSEADAAFGRAVLDLLRDPQERARLGKAASKIARERSSPLAVQQRIADAFRHAGARRRLRLRPAAEGPRVLQWLTTFKHFRPWRR